MARRVAVDDAERRAHRPAAFSASRSTIISRWRRRFTALKEEPRRSSASTTSTPCSPISGPQPDRAAPPAASRGRTETTDLIVSRLSRRAFSAPGKPRLACPRAQVSMTTLLLTHSACLDHVTPPGHPECADGWRDRECLSQPRFDGFRATRRRKAIDSVTLLPQRAYVTELRATSRRQAGMSMSTATPRFAGTWEAVMRGSRPSPAADAVMSGKHPTPSSRCAARPSRRDQ